MMFSICSQKDPFEEHTRFALAILFMSLIESQAQSAPNTCVRHKREHELSTRSSAVVQETMPN